MMIIAVGGQKGGTGKTTIATELVIYLCSKNKKVLLVDADDQQTATDFSQSRTESIGETGYTTIQLSEKTLASEVPKFRLIYDYIVIDSGGFDSISQRYAISVCDKYLSVFKPESFALWTIDQVEQMINLSITGNNKIKCYSCLNMGWPSGQDNQDSAAILKDSELINFLPHVIVRRKAFTDSGGAGLSVSERRPADKKAIKEITDFLQALVEG